MSDVRNFIRNYENSRILYLLRKCLFLKKPRITFCVYVSTQFLLVLTTLSNQRFFETLQISVEYYDIIFKTQTVVQCKSGFPRSIICGYETKNIAFKPLLGVFCLMCWSRLLLQDQMLSIEKSIA